MTRFGEFGVVGGVAGGHDVRGVNADVDAEADAEGDEDDDEESVEVEEDKVDDFELVEEEEEEKMVEEEEAVVEEQEKRDKEEEKEEVDVCARGESTDEDVEDEDSTTKVLPMVEVEVHVAGGEVFDRTGEAPVRGTACGTTASVYAANIHEKKEDHADDDDDDDTPEASETETESSFGSENGGDMDEREHESEACSEDEDEDAGADHDTDHDADNADVGGVAAEVPGLDGVVEIHDPDRLPAPVAAPVEVVPVAGGGSDAEDEVPLPEAEAGDDEERAVDAEDEGDEDADADADYENGAGVADADAADVPKAEEDDVALVLVALAEQVGAAGNEEVHVLGGDGDGDMGDKHESRENVEGNDEGNGDGLDNLEGDGVGNQEGDDGAAQPQAPGPDAGDYQPANANVDVNVDGDAADANGDCVRANARGGRRANKVQDACYMQFKQVGGSKSTAYLATRDQALARRAKLKQAAEEARKKREAAGKLELEPELEQLFVAVAMLARIACSFSFLLSFSFSSVA